MKKNSLISLVMILALCAAIAYGVIWYLKKKSSGTGANNSNSSGSDTNTNSGSGSTNTNGSLSDLQNTNMYQWWINKIGHANFPIKMNSKGVEVLKIQEVLNTLLQEYPNWDVDPIAEDGIWGFNTQTRFKLLYPGYDEVSQAMFIQEFDPTHEIV